MKISVWELNKRLIPRYLNRAQGMGEVRINCNPTTKGREAATFGPVELRAHRLVNIFRPVKEPATNVCLPTAKI